MYGGLQAFEPHGFHKAPGAWEQAETRLGKANFYAGFVDRNSMMAGECKFKSATECRSLNQCDNGFAKFFKRPKVSFEALYLLKKTCRLGGANREHGLQIGPCEKA